LTGEKAPDFTLNHLEGRSVSLSDFAGKRLVILFGARNTGEQAGEIAQTIWAHFAPDELPIVSVIDLNGIPRIMRPVAKSMVEKAYKDTVHGVTAQLQQLNHPVPADPSEMVVMLMDWDGKVTSSYGVGDVDKEAAAVVVDDTGVILGSASGAGAGNEALALLG
jgi:hypothetical protein